MIRALRLTNSFRLLLISLLFFIITGCGFSGPAPQQSTTIGNPTASDILASDPSANIVVYQDIVYQAGIQWVDELELTKGELVLEILKYSRVGNEFANGTASGLPVGTKIYRVKERGDIVIAETDQGDIRFYALVEG